MGFYSAFKWLIATITLLHLTAAVDISLQREGNVVPATNY